MTNQQQRFIYRKHKRISEQLSFYIRGEEGRVREELLKQVWLTIPPLQTIPQRFIYQMILLIKRHTTPQN